MSESRSELLTPHPGTARLLRDIATAEDCVDPCHAADADVRPDPYDGGCPADCNTPPGRVTGDTDGRTDAPLSSDPYAGFERAARNAGMVEGARHLRGLGMDAAADALYAEAARRAGL